VLGALGKAVGLRGLRWTEDPAGTTAGTAREGQDVELESNGQLQQDGKLQRAVREGMVAGLSTRNYRRAVESVLEGYGIEKSSVSRQFVAASCHQLRLLCERRLEDLNLVVLMIDGIHFGGQCWWWLWGSRKAEKSTCWECGKEPRRTPRWSR